MACRQNDPALLGCGNAGAGPAEIMPAAQADLDEDQGSAIVADQVDFTAANAEIACDDMQATRFKNAGGQCFGFATTRRGGIVCLCLHVYI